MALKLSVQQQNELTRTSIRRVAQQFIDRSCRYEWIRTLLTSNGLDYRAGILIQLCDVPSQDGDRCHCTWLTRAHEFFEFDVLLSRQTFEILEVEHFENVTDRTLVCAHLQGTGKSFGYIAIEVLGEFV
jgi:hypothetical protein